MKCVISCFALVLALFPAPTEAAFISYGADSLIGIETGDGSATSNRDGDDFFHFLNRNQVPIAASVFASSNITEDGFNGELSTFLFAHHSLHESAHSYADFRVRFGVTEEVDILLKGGMNAVNDASLSFELISIDDLVPQTLFSAQVNQQSSAAYWTEELALLPGRIYEIFSLSSLQIASGGPMQGAQSAGSFSIETVDTQGTAVPESAHLAFTGFILFAATACIRGYRLRKRQ